MTLNLYRTCQSLTVFGSNCGESENRTGVGSIIGQADDISAPKSDAETYLEFMSATSGPQLKDLKKAEAAAIVLKENNKPMKVRAIFEEMKKRGHPVQDPDSLRTLLSKDPRFMKTAPGEYDLDPLF